MKVIMPREQWMSCRREAGPDGWAAPNKRPGDREAGSGTPRICSHRCGVRGGIEPALLAVLAFVLHPRPAGAGARRRVPMRLRVPSDGLSAWAGKAGPTCQHPGGCEKRASFGENGGRPRVCAEHRVATVDVNLNRKRCRHLEGCGHFAYYQAVTAWPALGLAGAPRRRPAAEFCAVHRLAGAAAGAGMQCTAGGCQVQATFGEARTRKPLRCRRHRRRTDVDTRHAPCMHEGCVRRAYYGEAGGPALTCLQHKREGHLDVTSKRCEAVVDAAAAAQAAGMDTSGDAASFGEATAVVRRNSQRRGLCQSQANFGDALERRKRFCAKHRRGSDIDLRKRGNGSAGLCKGKPKAQVVKAQRHAPPDAKADVDIIHAKASQLPR